MENGARDTFISQCAVHLAPPMLPIIKKLKIVKEKKDDWGKHLLVMLFIHDAKKQVKIFSGCGSGKNGRVSKWSTAKGQGMLLTFWGQITNKGWTEETCIFCF